MPTPFLSPLPLTIPDLILLDDMTPMALETLSDLQTLGQDLYHRLLEAPGSNIDDPSVGIGLAQLLSSSTVRLEAAASIVDSQFKKDKRVAGSSTTIVLNPDASYTIDVQVVASGALLPLRWIYSKQTGLVPAQASI